jgi:L-threonylcarbamoyladenylate synthase
MAIYPANDEGVGFALRQLGEGECIGLPTETVYGLAADGLDAQAVIRIFEIKQRPLFDPLILHVASGYDVERICVKTPLAEKLMRVFWPGPLTLILERRDVVPDLVASGLPTVAVRCPDHPVAQRLLVEFGKPLAAPSANRFGRISPTDAAAVDAELGEDVGVILDGGPCRVGLESTIVDATGDVPLIVRKGGVTFEELEKVCGKVGYADSKEVQPGTLEHHYAPLRPLYRSEVPLHSLPDLPQDYGYLFWSRPHVQKVDHFRVLAHSGEVMEGALNLFRYMRELDALPVERIIVDPVPEDGLGVAVADRLWKASQGTAVWNGDEFNYKRK